MIAVDINALTVYRDFREPGDEVKQEVLEMPCAEDSDVEDVRVL
jgi:hypothetical protein